MSPSPRECLFLLFSVSLMFGFTTQSNNSFNALTLSEEETYNLLHENARAKWLLMILHKVRMKLHKEKEDVEMKLEKEKAYGIFSKFMCAMRLMRMQIDNLISAATSNAKSTMTDIHCTSRQIPDDEKSEMESTIQRIMGKDSEKFINDAHKLSVAFYWAITDSKFGKSKYLVRNLTKINCKISECAAVTAAFRKVCDNYVHKNQSPTVNIYLAFSKLMVINFFDVIREYNNWSVTPRDLDIINIVFQSLMNMSTFRYSIIKTNENKTVAVPFPESDTLSPNCL